MTKTSLRNCLLLFFSALSFTAQSSIHSIGISVCWVRYNGSLSSGTSRIVYNSMEVNPLAGDTFVLVSGTREPLRFDDLKGDSLLPIKIVNEAIGRAVITKPNGGYYGITFNNCRYVKLSGKQNPTLAYGIFITQIPSGNGVSINNFSSNFEMEGLEISRVYAAGITAKSDPTCANYHNYLSFCLYDLRLHHNYIHHVGNEGFYVGHTGYNEGNGINLNCSNPSFSIKVLPHKLIGVSIYENVCDSTGWDAIQVAASTQVSIFNNYIHYDSYADVLNQMSGIMIGQPSRGKVFNNIVKDGKGIGIQCFGLGVEIFNNLIINPANSSSIRGNYNSQGVLVNTTLSQGIYINDKVCKDTSLNRTPYMVAHNTIIINKAYRVGAPYNTWGPQGINMNAISYVQGSIIASNLIVIDTNSAITQTNPVNGVYCSNSVPGYSISNAPGFISASGLNQFMNNFFSNEITSVGFENTQQHNYRIVTGAAALDNAMASIVSNHTFLNRDLDNTIRPQGSMPDFGCYEYINSQSNQNSLRCIIIPNPVSFSSGSSFLIRSQVPAYFSSITLTLLGTGNNFNEQTLLNETVSNLHLENGNVEVNIPYGALPVNPGLYTIKVYVNNSFAAFANLLLIP